MLVWPTSSPKITRMLGFLACANKVAVETTSVRAKTPALTNGVFIFAVLSLLVGIPSFPFSKVGASISPRELKLGPIGAYEKREVSVIWPGNRTRREAGSTRSPASEIEVPRDEIVHR